MPAPAPTIPAKHKAAVYDKPGTISTQVVEVDTPKPGPGEVLVRLTHSGVCHSDLSVMINGWKALPAPTAAGQVGGHEGVGEVVALGPGVDENGDVKIGSRVGIKWMSGTCGLCEACFAGADAMCKKGKISGYYTPGTFQQYVLGPADYVTPIPDGLDSAVAAPMLCAGVTVYSAIKKAGLQGGQWLVIFGSGGGLGSICTSLAAKGMGLRVIGVDHGSKKETSLSNGCEEFIDFTEVKDIPARVKEITGLGAHGAIVLTAANSAYADAPLTLRFRGTAVCVGIPDGDLVPVGSAAPAQLIFTEVNIRGSAVGNRREAIETLDFAKRGVASTPFRLAKLEDLTQVFQDMKDGKIQGRVVLDLQ